MKNVEIRCLISDLGIRYKDVAAVMGINRTSLSRLMREDLSERSKRRILNAIESIEQRKKA